MTEGDKNVFEAKISKDIGKGCFPTQEDFYAFDLFLRESGSKIIKNDYKKRYQDLQNYWGISSSFFVSKPGKLSLVLGGYTYIILVLTILM